MLTKVRRDYSVCILIGWGIGVLTMMAPTIFESTELLILDSLLNNPRPMQGRDYDSSYQWEIDLIQFMEWHGSGQVVCRHLVTHAKGAAGYTGGALVILPFELQRDSFIAAIPELDKMLRDPTTSDEDLRTAAIVRRRIIEKISEPVTDRSRDLPVNEKVNEGVRPL